MAHIFTEKEIIMPKTFWEGDDGNALNIMEVYGDTDFRLKETITYIDSPTRHTARVIAEEHNKEVNRLEDALNIIAGLFNGGQNSMEIGLYNYIGHVLVGGSPWLEPTDLPAPPEAQNK